MTQIQVKNKYFCVHFTMLSLVVCNCPNATKTIKLHYFCYICHHVALKEIFISMTPYVIGFIVMTTCP